MPQIMNISITVSIDTQGAGFDYVTKNIDAISFSQWNITLSLHEIKIFVLIRVLELKIHSSNWKKILQIKNLSSSKICVKPLSFEPVALPTWKLQHYSLMLVNINQIVI